MWGGGVDYIKWKGERKGERQVLSLIEMERGYGRKVKWTD